MQYFFPDFSYAPVIAAILVSVFSAILGYNLVFKLRYFKELEENPIVPPFIAIPPLFLALLIAFMASAVWQNSSNALTALQYEKMALKKLYLMPVASAEAVVKKEKYLDTYVSVVQQEEWGKSNNMYPSKDAEAILDSLLKFIFIDQYNGVVQKNEFHNDAIKFIEELHSSRDKRLGLGRMAELGYLNKWIIIYLLIFVCCFNIALVQRGNPKAAKSSLSVFVFCCILTMSIVSLYIHPYKGPDALKASELSVNK